MNYDSDETNPDDFSPKGLGSDTPTQKPQRHRRNRWQPDATSIADIFSQCSACDVSHPYLVRNGITQSIGHVFNGTHIAGIPCEGAYVEFIHSSERKAINAVFKVQDANGIFEDLFIPNAPLGGCWSRIGAESAVKVVTVDHASGLAIHLATGLAVAVSHYDGNLLAVCKALRAAYPEDDIVIAAGARSSEEWPAIKKLVIAAAGSVSAFIALPGTERNFAALNMSQGAESVANCMSNARCLSPEWGAHGQGADAELPPRLAWPHSVHAGGLLAAMCAHLSRYTVLPFSAIYAMVLWILGTHLVSIFSVAPVLALLSLTRRCGKSVTLHPLTALVRKVHQTSDITAAGLMEKCDDGFTPFLDEADQYFQKRAHPLNAVVNSGHTRIASKVTRKGKEYQTFGFKLIAAIGTLPTTIMDRSIVIPLIRKNSKEKVDRYKEKENDQAAVLRAMIDRFVLDRQEEIQHAEPEAPEMTNDRALDNWEPLFAIASCAGPAWLKNAHEAALELTPGDDEIPPILEDFICDMVAIFMRSGADFIATSDLIKALCKDQDKPWATFSRNQQPMSIHDLGKLMREAKVKVGEQKHDKNGNRRGYYRKDVAHLFDGYAPSA